MPVPVTKQARMSVWDRGIEQWPNGPSMWTGMRELTDSMSVGVGLPLRLDEVRLRSLDVHSVVLGDGPIRRESDVSDAEQILKGWYSRAEIVGTLRKMY